MVLHHAAIFTPIYDTALSPLSLLIVIRGIPLLPHSLAEAWEDAHFSIVIIIAITVILGFSDRIKIRTHPLGRSIVARCDH